MGIGRDGLYGMVIMSGDGGNPGCEASEVAIAVKIILRRALIHKHGSWLCASAVMQA
jgi:hypothetical protein